MEIHNRLWILLSCLIGLIYGPVLSHGLEVATHEKLNVRIAESGIGGFSLSAYLIEDLKIQGGIEEKFGKFSIKESLQRGGRYEDEPPWWFPYVRSFNHFHNPITNQGLSTTVFSSKDWALLPVDKQWYGGNYSWHDAREYFYNALTATERADRENYFAETFRALGQVMHLVEDASVPSHTRDDPHVKGYEKWVDRLVTVSTIAPGLFTSWLLRRPTSEHPIANLFDTNQYTGAEPKMTVGSEIGLAEYTNANFFSEDTINSRRFPFPRIDANTPTGTRPIKGPAGMYDREYYMRNDCDPEDVEQRCLLAAVDYYDYWLKDPSLSLLVPPVPVPILDENVFKDYAERLIPHAVSYAAGLLKYFFRGRLKVTSIPIPNKNGIAYVRVIVRNDTPTAEAMGNGQVALTYRYTPKNGNPDGSDDIYGEAWASSTSKTAPCPGLAYEDEVTLDFTVLPEPIPLESWESVKLSLAFRGTLGEEQGAVIGKVVTLGEIKFNEEWDKDLTANHTWAQTDFNLIGQNPQNGSTSNVLSGDVLVKDNIRYRGHKTARVNETFVATWVNDGEFKDILPIPITPASYLQFKIDSMSINAIPPAEPGETNQFQGLWLYFSQGRALQLTQEGQGIYYTSETATYTFELGRIIVDNIYSMFENAGLPIVEESINLHGINFLQQLFDMKEPSTVDHHQHMEVDFIRIIEAKEE